MLCLKSMMNQFTPFLQQSHCGRKDRQTGEKVLWLYVTPVVPVTSTMVSSIFMMMVGVNCDGVGSGVVSGKVSSSKAVPKCDGKNN